MVHILSLCFTSVTDVKMLRPATVGRGENTCSLKNQIETSEKSHVGIAKEYDEYCDIADVISQNCHMFIHIFIIFFMC